MLSLINIELHLYTKPIAEGFFCRLVKMSTSVKPIAIVSPMKKLRKVKKKKSAIKKIQDGKDQLYVSGKQSGTFCKKSETTDTSSDYANEKMFPISPLPKRRIPKCIKRLCAKVENLHLTPISMNSTDVCGKIPEHDRKILERMAAKMQREISNLEIAHQAHVVWENEKEQRKKIQLEQEQEYNAYLKAKRNVENEFYKQKRLENQELYDWEREYLTSRILEKDQAAENRLKMIHFRKLNEIHEKQEISKEKFEQALVSLREKKFEDVLWRKTLAEDCKQRNAKAEANREILLRLIKQRTTIDNKIHKEIHEQNWIDQKILEMEQLMQLKKRVVEKNEKMEGLRIKKETFIRKSRQLADSTAKMRENLKRSLSPDVCQRGVSPWFQPLKGMKYQICLSPNNYDSSVRLG